MGNTKIDILLYIITFTIIIWLFIKTKKDYKILTLPDRKKGVIISPRSFLWKGGLLIFIAFYMISSAPRIGLFSLILFASLFVLGGWNLYYALLYYKWRKQKK